VMTRGKDIKRRPWPPEKADLEALIEEAIVDAYGESEQRTGFHTMIEETPRCPVRGRDPRCCSNRRADRHDGG
jgi:hypothetical protein